MKSLSLSSTTNTALRQQNPPQVLSEDISQSDLVTLLFQDDEAEGKKVCFKFSMFN